VPGGPGVQQALAVDASGGKYAESRVEVFDEFAP
jgi:hypothetical protein